MILDRLDRLGTRERLGIGFSLLLLLGLLCDWLVVRPLLEACAAMERESESLRGELSYNASVLATRPGVDAVYARYAGLLGTADAAAADIDVMKGQIDDLARQAGLLLVSMKHREPRAAADGSHVEYAIEVTGFEGSMQGLLRFLSAVQQSALPGLLRVTQVSVSPVRGQDAVKGAMTVSKIMIRPDGA